MLNWLNKQEDFNQQQESLKTLTSSIVSVRIALLEKGIVTEEELLQYDEQATETVDGIFKQQMKEVEKELRKTYGDEVFNKLIKPNLGMNDNE